MNICIINVPPGEAPHEIRAAWVGLSLPLSTPDVVTTRSVGVVTGPRNLFVAWIATLFGGGQRERGYRVESLVAIELLSRHAPAAAAGGENIRPTCYAPG